MCRPSLDKEKIQVLYQFCFNWWTLAIANCYRRKPGRDQAVTNETDQVSCILNAYGTNRVNMLFEYSFLSTLNARITRRCVMIYKGKPEKLGKGFLLRDDLIVTRINRQTRQFTSRIIIKEIKKASF